MSHKESRGASKNNLSRRQVLTAGSTAAAAAALGGRSSAKVVVSSQQGIPVPAPAPTVWFKEPPVIQSSGGVLSHDFKIVGSTPPGATEMKRFYNGLPLGPTMKVKRNDCLLLNFINELPKDQCNQANLDFCCSKIADVACCDPDHNKPHCFNTTNLHTHGLHVSAAAFLNNNGELIASDEVLLEIEPGELQKYCIWLPNFHAPGSYWYHAHKHGSVALQLSSGNGLCGAIIIQEDVDEQILDPNKPDRVWIMQEQVDDQASLVYSCLGPAPTSFTINGCFQPTLKMAAGQVQRWRFINATATPRGFGTIQLLDSNDNPVPYLHAIAVDGITFYGKAPQTTTGWVLPPGGRVDFLVRIPPTVKAQTYKVHKAPVPGVFSTIDQDLAFIQLSNFAVNDQLPAVLPQRPNRTCYLEPIFKAELKPDPVVFAVGGMTCGGQPPGTLIPTDFTIDGAKFDPDVVNHKIPLGDVQEWELQNTSAALHPFHIHVNPFQVVGEKVDPAGPDDPTNWMWRDTVAIPTGSVPNPGQVNIRHRFLTYDGKFVLHCHILNHEDLGMMQIVQVGKTTYDPDTGARISGNGIGPCEPAYNCSF